MWNLWYLKLKIWHLFPDKAIWNPPIHMRLLHHGVELTLKGQSSWAPNSAWSRAFFHPKHPGESPEQRVLNGFETGADHHFMASGFGVYSIPHLGLNSNGILDQTKSFNRRSSNIEVRENGATRPVLVLKSTSRSSLFPFVKLGCITSGWHHLTSKYSMSISKCQVQHDEGPKVSAKPGRFFQVSNSWLQHTRQVQKPRAPPLTSWESENLLSNEFFEKRKTHAEISCLPFPWINSSISQYRPQNAPISRQPTSSSHPTNQEVPGTWMRTPPAGGRGIFASLEATGEPWKTCGRWYGELENRTLASSQLTVCY